jgi:hypothetical protein
MATAHTSNSLVISNELTHDSLRALTVGEIDVIWHRAFYPAEACLAALPRITAACKDAQYTLTADLQSIGTSSGEAAESQANRERYLDTAAATTRAIRDGLFRGVLSPPDRLRLLIDEYWPHGASVAHDAASGRQLLPAILRRWPSGGHANPHIDQNDTSLITHLKIARRIGTNVYLEVPPGAHGGEIEFWSRINEADYLKIKRGDYGLDRSTLGEPAYSLLPAQGDLVMFDASIIHGVARVARGSRVTAACFLGYVSPSSPMVIFA